MAQDLLKANVGMAQKNRNKFNGKKVLAINLISSPGAGKTTLLEKTLEELTGQLNIAVIEGDIYTSRDAERLEGKGAEVVQINTAGACHLDAGMIAGVLKEFSLEDLDILFIENVGNLVCPAEFDLGEDYKVALLSVSEGSDKPAKYPLVFREANACIINKTDLIPYTDFNLERVTEEIKDINGSVKIFPLSSVKGEGIGEWCRWLKDMKKRKSSTVTG
ncbi:MAG: hydrogenase accessory protein HypB [Candidatus Syntrophonatronum acetioxidans]|uniref:Hydrogenase accessory protein HypB n=1 Tax=Candidatus Syntrophonatronum acetioxidans TaxID=1795816 RepID=A0A424YE33_9FIRM|nr:MAG: hydrogenase accessory protein HypB [Candidatus Syntrophonatronum acetioxidans]